MTPEQQKEEISKAYLQAIAARCGLTVSSWSQDHGNIDATVCAARSPIPGGRARAKLDIQLKCTARQDLLRDDFLSWDLERAHYDGLRCAAVIPHLLVVLLLRPRIEHSAEQLILRKCAYWVTMTGMSERATEHVTVRLPRSQVFSPAQLGDLMDRVSRGEVI